MTVDNFRNETFDFNLSFIVYDYSKTKEFNKAFKIANKAGVDKNPAIDLMKTSRGFFVGGNPYCIFVDSSCFKLKTKKGIANILKTIQHECGHLREQVLMDMSETIDKTDREVYLRISDWAFGKCLSTKFVKKFFKATGK